MTFHFETAARTDVGRVRSLNEDSYLSRPDLGLWVVADGMGGHDHGDRASRLITDRLGEIENPGSARDLLRCVEQTLSRINDELRREAEPHGIIGSTVVALLVFDGHFACVWSGDSRIYRLSRGSFEQLTTDHTMIQEMVDEGRLSPQQARHHPLGNRITRAVGADNALQIEVIQGEIGSGDRFLLCSDGLTGELDDDRIVALLKGAGLEEAADKLLHAVLSTEARDNVTFVIVDARLAHEDDDMDSTVPQARQDN